MFCKKIIVNCCKYLINKLQDDVPKKIIDNNVKTTSVNVDSVSILQHTKIPKVLHFCNVGSDDFVDCVNNAINEFKNLNPEFTVNILKFSFDDFFKQDGIFDHIQRYGWEKCKKLNKFQLRTIINDFMTSYVCVHGGIYLSDNTFPIKKFDFDLLNLNGFCSTIYDINYNIACDCSMVGSIPNNISGLCNIFPPINTNISDYGSILLSYKNCRLKNKAFSGKYKKCQPYIIKFDV